MKPSASTRPPSAPGLRRGPPAARSGASCETSCHSAAVAALLVDLAQAAPQRHATRRRCRTRGSPSATQAYLQRLGLVQLVHALVDREQAAHAEQHQRDDEAPEVDRLAVAERMSAVGGLRPLRRPHSSSPWLPQSANEWIASASIDDEPVKIAPAVLASAIAKLAPSANRIDLQRIGACATCHAASLAPRFDVARCSPMQPAT